MQITFVGSNTNFLGDVFFGTSGSEDSLQITGVTPTQITGTNTETGLSIIATGSNFVVNTADGGVDGGPITGFQIFDADNNLEATISGIAWGNDEFGQALSDIEEFGDLSGLAALINASGPLTIDASGASAGLNMFELLDQAAFMLTTPMTFIGSDFGDTAIGTSGADDINMGINPFVGDYIAGSLGNDTIRFTDVDVQSYVGLFYDAQIGGNSFLDFITVTIDGGANTGTISGGINGVPAADFTDTLVDIRNIMTADGLGITGTGGEDQFNITLQQGDWMQIRNSGSTDFFDVTLNGGVLRLDYRNSDFGLDVDLRGATYGGQAYDGRIISTTLNGPDFVTIADTPGRLEIRGTDFADTMFGGDRNESFILRLGNDTVDGGAGSDRVRYDRSGVEAVNVDLDTDTATGTWDGTAFTHTLIDVEEIRGSRDGDDTILGNSDRDDVLLGRGGNDSLDGRDGNDWLEGEDGNDTLLGGAGADELRGGSAFDLLRGGLGNDTLDGGLGRDIMRGEGGNDILRDNGQRGDLGRDLFFGGFGNDTIFGGGANDTAHGENGNDVIYGGLDNDLAFGGNGFDRILGQGGNDTLVGGNGRDTLRGGFGNDVLNDNDQRGPLGRDLFFGENGNDTLNGGSANDTLNGGNGNDVIRGGLDNDLVFGGAGFDRILGQGGNDVVFGGNGRDTMEGGFGNDRLIDNGQGGTLGADIMDGQVGNDTLRIGAGDDTATGGAGSDTFIFFTAEHGADVITDFDALDADEVIDLSAIASIGDITELLGAATQVGADVLIDTGGGNSILLEGVDRNDLDDSDFLF